MSVGSSAKRSLLVAMALFTGPAVAASPVGWTGSTYDGFTHVERGATCPPASKDFVLQHLAGPSEPTTLGVCEYTDPNGHRGEIRVRRYVPGVGETPLAIQSDRVLMGDAQPADLQANQQIVSAIREGPGLELDGDPSHRIVITVALRGLLVDCAGWMKESEPDDSAIFEFALLCNHMPGA